MNKNKLENIILVSRPINFLFAIEICRSFQDENFIILIFSNTDKREINAMNLLKSEFKAYLPNAEFKTFNNHFPVEFLNVFLFKLYLKFTFSGKRFDKIITSGGVKGRLLVKLLKFEEVIITDEGLSSIKRFPRIIKRNKIFGQPTAKHYVRNYRLLGIYDMEPVVKFKLWTIYDQLSCLGGKVRVTHFENIKNIVDHINFEINENQVVILGTCPKATKIGIMKYKELLRKTAMDFEAFEIYLKPHKLFHEVFEFQELKTDLPIEYFFIKNKSLPKYLFSFSSTSNQIMEYLFPQVVVKNIWERPGHY